MLVIVSSFVAVSTIGVAACSTSGTGQRPTHANGIALIDQLGSKYPNPDFVNEIRNAAHLAGYGFDYYGADQVTVDLFTQLPTKDYAMIILRNHGIGISAGSIVITTSETYSQYGHVGDQLTDRLVEVKVNHTITFGLTQHFIENEMCGQFPGTMVLFMGCGGLSRQWLADSFLKKGARAFVGWEGTVTVNYDDLAIGLLGRLLIQGHAVDWALQNVTETLRQGGAGLGLAPANAAFVL